MTGSVVHKEKFAFGLEKSRQGDGLDVQTAKAVKNANGKIVRRSAEI